MRQGHAGERKRERKREKERGRDREGIECSVCATSLARNSLGARLVG